jgi:hypothetical protein
MRRDVIGLSCQPNKGAVMRTTIDVWDGRELSYIANDVRIQFQTHSDEGIVGTSAVAVSWEEAWGLFDQLRYLLHDEEVRERMIAEGQIDRLTAELISK